MRTALALFGLVLLIASVKAPAWSAEDVGDHHVTVSLHEVVECNRYGTCHVDELHEMQGFGRTGQAAAAFCAWAALAAAAAIAIGGLALGRRPVPLIARAALCIPLLVSLGATLVVMDDLGRVSWLSFGWPPFAALAGAVAGFYPVLSSRAGHARLSGGGTGGAAGGAGSPV